jgi:hypothetical protein
MRFHVAAEGGIDAALISPAPCFKEVHHVGIEPKRDLFLLAGPEGRSRNSADLPRLIADEESGNLTVIDDKLFSMIERSSR